jgi:hypothetical protein
MNETHEYESVTEYLMEGNSPELLTEEQQYLFLTEYFEKDYVDSLNEEEREHLFEVAWLGARIAGTMARKAAGQGLGLLSRGISRTAGTVARGLGGGYIARAGRALKAKVGAGIERHASAEKKNLQARQKDVAPGSVEAGKIHAKLKQHSQRGLRLTTKAARSTRHSPLRAIGAAFRRGLEPGEAASKKTRFSNPQDDPSKPPELAHTVYARIGSLLGEEDK